MKGNADCHIPNNKYRSEYDRIFGRSDKNIEKKKKNPYIVEPLFNGGVEVITKKDFSLGIRQ